MAKIIYTVTCRIDYPSQEEEWLKWIKEEHMAKVLSYGAESAQIIRRDPESDSAAGVYYDVFYWFAERSTYETYINDYAPKLRRESIELFPPSNGFHYTRFAGELIS